MRLEDGWDFLVRCRDGQEATGRIPSPTTQVSGRKPRITHYHEKRQQEFSRLPQRWCAGSEESCITEIKKDY